MYELLYHNFFAVVFLLRLLNLNDRFFSLCMHVSRKLFCHVSTLCIQIYGNNMYVVLRNV